MKSQRLFDTHTHSLNSPDGFDSVDEMCRSAIEKGLSVITITDHYEIPDRHIPKYKAAIYEGYQDILKAKEKYKDKIEVLAGIELGGAKYCVEHSKEVLRLNHYDFVLNSLHGIPGQTDYHDRNYEGYDYNPMLIDYYTELLEQCKLDLFDSLAHLDYPTRYIRLQGIAYDESHYTEYTDKILTYLAQNGKALEINTSGLFSPFKQTLPSFNAVKRFRELGGEFITIGSDSHEKELVARGFDEAVDMAYQAGFKYVTYFKDRKPVCVNII
ncbi:MAG: histidinol-phosphatase HisJ family protein [Clostridia bacterium]|nr:histidinol-phosphatase HisJ family protein [Clostridia bacterium]